MKNQLDHNQALYGPQAEKSFDGALISFFARECPQLGGHRTRQVLVQSVREMVNQFFPETNHLRPGQTPWTCVHKDEQASYGKRINQSKLTPVILEIVKPEDIIDRANGAKLRDLKKEASVRIFQQAYAQNGVLTLAEVGILLKISPPTVSKYVREWEEANESMVPRRGTIHDMGPTLTHKKEIVEKLVFDGKSVEVVCRETNHSPEAVLRYITNFKQVLLCRRKELDNTEIAFATKISLRLVEEYQRLIDDYSKKHPEWECNGEPWVDKMIDQLEKCQS
jgi:DNA-binding CsgD family transcriptional regulator